MAGARPRPTATTIDPCGHHGQAHTVQRAERPECIQRRRCVDVVVLAPSRGVNLELHTGNRLRLWISGTAATTDLNVSVKSVGKTADDAWHLATGVRRGKSVELYLDGIEVGKAKDVAGSIRQSAPRYFFGRDNRTGGTQFSGRLDDPTMWSRALTKKRPRTGSNDGGMKFVPPQ